MSGRAAEYAKRVGRRVLAVLTTFTIVTVISGCSAGPDGPLFSHVIGPNQLSGAAKQVCSAYAGPQALPRELDKHVAPLYTAEPGDVLLVQPAQIDSPARFPADQPVLPDGTINLGQFGLLAVAGRTVPEIEQLAKAQIEGVLKSLPSSKEPKRPADRRDPHDVGPITVRVVTRQSKVFYVLGEVNAPGSFTLTGNETVLDGILAAGGLNERASSRNIILCRPTPPDGCRVVLPICYREITQLGDTSTNYQLSAGDRIFVAGRTHGESCGEDKHGKHESPACCNNQRPCTDCTGSPRECAFRVQSGAPSSGAIAPSAE
jgi:protein involved in polysaccharide export with SLBB domain